jgi:hypothetical protein
MTVTGKVTPHAKNVHCHALVVACGCFAATIARPLLGQQRLLDHFPQAASSGCMHCHTEIEPIREVGSEMLSQIMSRGEEIGDPAGCVVCHNGDATETDDKTIAHGGENFFADPGASPP